MLVSRLKKRDLDIYHSKVFSSVRLFLVFELSLHFGGPDMVPPSAYLQLLQLIILV